MKTVFNWALTPQPPAVKQYQDIPWLPRAINSKEFEITHLVKNHNNILLSFTTKTKYGTYVLGMHRRLSLPEFLPVGYLANIKAGYRISNVAGYRIPDTLLFKIYIANFTVPYGIYKTKSLSKYTTNLKTSGLNLSAASWPPPSISS